jgi:hypothetical protein
LNFLKMQAKFCGLEAAQVSAGLALAGKPSRARILKQVGKKPKN